MINFRFHLVSIVAVFLALGLGVAMGASFIDRVTVETMRGRLDQLEANYRERGEEIDALRAQVAQLDRDAAALLDEDAALLAGRLEDTTVVLLAETDLDGGVLEVARAALDAADAVDGGAVLVDLERLAADAAVLEELRALVGLEVAAPVRVRERVLSSIGDALAVLGAGTDVTDPEQVPSPGTTAQPGAMVPPGDPVPGPTVGDVAPPTDPDAVTGDAARADAEELVSELVRIGVLRLEPSETTSDALFAAGPVHYVLISDPDDAGTDDTSTPAAGPGIDDVVASLADGAPATLVVAGPASARPAGAVTDTERSEGWLVEQLRGDDAVAASVSTVDHLDEVLGQLALVLAIEEQLRGLVGHYGVGDGATAPLPRAPD